MDTLRSMTSLVEQSDAQILKMYKYRTYTIVTRGLYILTLLFEGKNRLFEGIYS